MLLSIHNLEVCYGVISALQDVSLHIDAGEIVRTVGTTKAYISFKGRLWKVPQAFCGERVAIRPRATDGQYGVFFGAHPIAELDLATNKSVHHVSEQVSTMSPG